MRGAPRTSCWSILMSERNTASPSPSPSDAATQNDIPRMEPWLAVTLLSFVPGLGLFILPSQAMIPLYAVMGALMVTGLGMFLRTEFTRQK